MQKRLKKTVQLGIAGLCIASVCRVIGAEPSDPLLDLFVKKGYVTEEEAQRVKAEADALRTNAVAAPAESKWSLSKGLKKVELFGDLRTRYEGRSASDPAGGTIGLDRYRYAVRFGLRGEVFDDFYYGLRIETSTNPRSTWATFGGASPGPFGKSNGQIGIGQMYIGWHPESWTDITFGKMPNPLYVTPMVWDTDLNPEGLAEHFNYTIGEADFFANFGQFVYQDTNPTRASKGYFNPLRASGEPFLIAWQAGANYRVTKSVSFKAAPVVYQYTAFHHGHTPPTSFSPDFSGTFVGQGTTVGVNGAPASYNLASSGFDGFFSNEEGINDLLVLDVPFELNAKLECVDLRLFGDYAQNLEGADRANAAFNVANSFYFSSGGPSPNIAPISAPQTHDVKAYQFGLAVAGKDSLGLVYGANVHRHAWEFRTYWQHIEQYALDPNLVDSDFFEGRLNMEGIYTAIAYGFNNNVLATARYGYARRINNKLGTGGSNADIPQMNPIDHYNLLQVDLTFKF